MAASDSDFDLWIYSLVGNQKHRREKAVIQILKGWYPGKTRVSACQYSFWTEVTLEQQNFNWMLRSGEGGRGGGEVWPKRQVGVKQGKSEYLDSPLLIPVDASLACTRKNGRARRRHACLPRARPFSLSPTTSKRLLRRLCWFTRFDRFSSLNPSRAIPGDLLCFLIT